MAFSSDLYDTWDWDKATGTGATVSLDTRRMSPLLKDETEAGYMVTRAAYTRDKWKFLINFKVLSPSGYIYLHEFFYDHRGGIPFFFRIPVGLYGIPLQYVIADPGGVSPWSSELDVSYGEAPTYIVRFVNDELSFKRREDTVQNYWFSSEDIELRQL